MYKHFTKLLIWLSFLTLSARAGANIVINIAKGKVMIGTQVYVLQSDRELDFKDVLNSPGFKKNNMEVPNLGFSGVSTWLRFTIANQTNNSQLLLDVAYPILDEVELFSPDGQNHYRGNLMGEVKSFNTRKYKHPDYIFDLDIPANTSKTYYLRIKSAEQLIVPISVSQPTDLWLFLRNETLLSGIFMGAVIIMFFYNLFVYFSVKDKSYVYYVIYVASVGFTQLGIKGYPFQYLWGNYPAFELKSVILFACISAVAAILFTQTFLSTRQRAPKFNVALIIVIVLLSIAFLITATGVVQSGFKLMQLATTLCAFGMLIVSAIVLRKGYGPARFVFFSWSVLLAGAIIFALKDSGVLPFNTFTSYSMQGASVIEMSLLSFGLANRINILKKEKEASQAQALQTLQENERIIREQNIVLELKVDERTHELKETNEELNTTLEDLKQAQSQLVESEKMASLGQLTAGIAHEINNPINFVTANINPLKRNIGLVLEALAVFESVGISELATGEKRRKIDEYKEEMDFDYLTLETNQLIKGIKEGATRTAEIVKSLKIFSRLDEDDLKRTDINEGLASTMVIANNLLNGKINVIRKFGDLPLAECYAGKLNQVFLNVISNAIYAVQKQFGDQIGGEIFIITTCDEKNIYVIIKDNGIGMDANTQKKIFEPFFTTKEVGEGTGLGMSIAYNTIKKHNGRILLSSAPGNGTEFTLEIPLVFSTKPVEPEVIG